MYKIPETFEEGMARKLEIEKIMEEYNESFFKGEEPKFTTEEIELFQDEYLMLDRMLVDDTKDDDDSTEEDQTPSFIDKVSTPLFLLPLFSLIFYGVIFVRSIGAFLPFKFIDKLLQTNAKMTKISYYLLCVLCYVIFPLIPYVVTKIIEKFTKKEENKKFVKITKYVILGIFGVVVIYSLFAYAIPLYKVILESNLFR